MLRNGFCPRLFPKKAASTIVSTLLFRRVSRRPCGGGIYWNACSDPCYVQTRLSFFCSLVTVQLLGLAIAKLIGCLQPHTAGGGGGCDLTLFCGSLIVAWNDTFASCHTCSWCLCEHWRRTLLDQYATIKDVVANLRFHYQFAGGGRYVSWSLLAGQASHDAIMPSFQQFTQVD